MRRRRATRLAALIVFAGCSSGCVSTSTNSRAAWIDEHCDDSRTPSHTRAPEPSYVCDVESERGLVGFIFGWIPRG